MEATSSGIEVVMASSAAPRNVCAMPVESAIAFTLKVTTGALTKIKNAASPKRSHRPPSECREASSLHPVGFWIGIRAVSTPGRAKSGIRRNQAIDTT